MIEALPQTEQSNQLISPIVDVQMTDRDFVALRSLVHKNCGISLADAKKIMLTSRLQKRLRFHRLSSFAAYYDLVQKSPNELVDMINCVTTNKTDFFREPHHFDFVANSLLPEISGKADVTGGSKKLRVWHAGCSTGEEPYTLAMVLRNVLQENISRWDIKQLASDIDTNVLDHATTGIYDREKFEHVPENYRKHNFLNGAGERSEFVMVKDLLKNMITFRNINLLDPVWPIQPAVKFDVIFCRNVVIYFDKPTQRTLFTRFHSLLRSGGYLIIGHSESLLGVSTDFVSLGHTIYRANEFAGA